MKSDEDRLFEQWCRHADLRALGTFFDLVAPRLERLGLRLVGDAAEAEDLVQATFLAAIEQRSGLDPKRPAWPWLSRVLANKATDWKRRTARTLDPSRLDAPLDEDPSRPVERREFADEVEQAVARLEEPYRQVVLLRLRHGLSMVEIADVLNRSPGTVRVQLHRAAQKLRPWLSKSSHSVFLLIHGPTRGLTAIKSLVLSEAGAAGAVVSGGWVLGAWAVNQKIAWTAGLVVAALAITTWQVAPWPRSEGILSQTKDPSVAAPAIREASPFEELVAKEPLTNAEESLVEVVRQETVSAPESVEVTLAGRVLDATSQRAMANVEVALYRPRRVPLEQLHDDHPELYKVNAHGRLVPRFLADWPRVDRSGEGERSAETVSAFDYPDEEQDPWATTHTKTDGSFTFPRPETTFLLVAKRPGYGKRVRIISPNQNECQVGLYPVKRLVGQVKTRQGEPPERPLQLVFHSSKVTADHGRLPHSRSSSALGSNSLTPHLHEGSGDLLARYSASLESLGAWAVTTDADGRFEVDVAAHQVTVNIVTPGWRIAEPVGRHEVEEPLDLTIVGVPVFHFYDAENQKPVERVTLLGREQGLGSVRWGGEFPAPDGFLCLYDDSMVSPLYRQEAGKMVKMEGDRQRPSSFAAWADGYQASHFLLSDWSATGVVEVPMTAGSIEELHGTILREGEPAATAQVALLAHSFLQWSSHEGFVLDDASADSTGEFRLRAPSGLHLLRVRDEFTTYFQPVQLPQEEPTVIDLAFLGRIEVELTDDQGGVNPDHFVRLQSADGRFEETLTNSEGVAVFGSLSPARYEIHVPLINKQTFRGRQETREIELSRGERRRIAMAGGGTRPIHGSISVSGVADYTGWQARLSNTGAWVDVDTEGQLPMDLRTEARSLEVEAPGGRRWSLWFPPEVKDGHVFQLDSGDGSYSGVLLDVAGSPLPGKRLFVTPWKTVTPFASTVTDANGEFSVEGLAPILHHFHVVDEDDEVFRGNSTERMFRPTHPASEHPEVVVRLPGAIDSTLVTGTVIRQATGEPLADATITLRSDLEVDGGVWWIDRTSNPITRTNGNGAFQIRRPIASLHIAVWDQLGTKEPLLEHTLNESEVREGRAVRLMVPEASAE